MSGHSDLGEPKGCSGKKRERRPKRNTISKNSMNLVKELEFYPGHYKFKYLKTQIWNFGNLSREVWTIWQTLPRWPGFSFPGQGGSLQSPLLAFLLPDEIKSQKKHLFINFVYFKKLIKTIKTLLLHPNFWSFPLTFLGMDEQRGSSEKQTHRRDIWVEVNFISGQLTGKYVNFATTFTSLQNLITTLFWIPNTLCTFLVLSSRWEKKEVDLFSNSRLYHRQIMLQHKEKLEDQNWLPKPWWNIKIHYHV